jgi:hypothetical protein
VARIIMKKSLMKEKSWQATKFVFQYFYPMQIFIMNLKIGWQLANNPA